MSWLLSLPFIWRSKFQYFSISEIEAYNIYVVVMHNLYILSITFIIEPSWLALFDVFNNSISIALQLYAFFLYAAADLLAWYWILTVGWFPDLCFVIMVLITWWHVLIQKKITWWMWGFFHMKQCLCLMVWLRKFHRTFISLAMMCETECWVVKKPTRK